MLIYSFVPIFKVLQLFNIRKEKPITCMVKMIDDMVGTCLYVQIIIVSSFKNANIQVNQLHLAYAYAKLELPPPSKSWPLEQ